MKIERIATYNWENAFHGLRHPYESYAKSDSRFGIGDDENWIDAEQEEVAESYITNWKDERVDPDKGQIMEWLTDNGILDRGKRYAGTYAFIGHNDLDLAQRMIKAGTPNDKFLRQIFVSMDITAPLYWWKEADTYKIGTTANSTSTMHKLASTPITKECFEMDDFNENLKMYEQEPYNTDEYVPDMWDTIIDNCECLRNRYLKTKDERYWKELIRMLPESWLQTRTWTANYAVLRNIYHWRKGHRLSEWRWFCDEIVKTLPYANELIVFDN